MTVRKTKKYFEGVGRRKSSVARVRVEEDKKSQILVNEKEAKIFFPEEEHLSLVTAPLRAIGGDGQFFISIHVCGGGKRGQAEAIKMGLSRALVKLNGDFHRILRDLDYLRRDPREKERKKPGLKKARRAPQFAKR